MRRQPADSRRHQTERRRAHRNVNAPCTNMDINTVQLLRGIGADPEEGIRRCGGNEGLYLRLLKKFTQQVDYEAEVDELLAEGNYKEAERRMHDLKGVAGNLSLNRLSHVTNEIDSALKKDEAPDAAAIEEWRELYEDVMAVINQLP